MATSRAYVITCNNWTQDDYDRLSREKHDYLIIAKEIGEGTDEVPEGTPHLQAFIYRKSKISFVGLHKRNPRCHLIPADGNAEQGSDYCKKGEQPKEEWLKEKTKGKNYGKNADFTEFGEVPSQGKRTDLDTIAAQITAGTTTAEEVLLTQPTMYHQYGRTLDKLEDLRMRKLYRTERTKCIWYYGPTGVGKSHTAFKNFTPETHYVYPTNDKGWWDAYKQQEFVIINEFRGQIAYSELLDLIDQYPKQVNRRGKEPMPFTSKMIIITSSLKPEDVYHNLSQHDSLAQLYDRIEVVQLTGESKRTKCV